MEWHGLPEQFQLMIETKNRPIRHQHRYHLKIHLDHRLIGPGCHGNWLDTHVHVFCQMKHAVATSFINIVRAIGSLQRKNGSDHCDVAICLYDVAIYMFVWCCNIYVCMVLQYICLYGVAHVAPIDQCGVLLCVAICLYDVARVAPIYTPVWRCLC